MSIQGKSRRSFQTEKNGGKLAGEASETAFSPFSAGEFTQTENPRKCLISRQLSETKKPTDRKGRQWAIGNEWSDKLGDSEPFSGVLQSQTRDLFKSQPSGERIIVVFRLEKQAEKVVWFLIGANGPSARRMDRRVRNGTILGGGSVVNRAAWN